MDTHIKIVAIINIVFGALGLLTGILLILIFGGAASIVGLTAQPEEALLAVPIISGVGIFIVIWTILFSLPAIIGGIGLLKYANWARILVLVLSVIGLLNIPIGTIIGAYSLWVLLNSETNQLFENPPIHQQTHVSQ